MKALRTLSLCVLIVLPATVPYAVHFLADRGQMVPTGFIQSDMPGYMAKAREYVDDGFRWTYANPSNPDPDAPRIYFQLWSLALGVLIGATGWDVGAIFVGFGVVAALAFAWSMVRLYRECFGLEGLEHWLGLIAFCWGGGLLVLGGLVASLAGSGPINRLTLFQFDPAHGWWFLNLGRNLVFPTEAFYHALFLATILAVIRRHHAMAVALAAITAACHPFTSMELTAILWTWLLVEVVFLRDRERLVGLWGGITAVLVGIVAYYLVFLERFESHRQVSVQYALDWSMKAETFVPAYALVGGLALWRLRTIDRAAEVLAEPRNRLFLVWFLVAFAMANHEFAFEPRQPLHFTRGYIWTPLFLLGAPALIEAFRRMRRWPGPIGGMTLAGVLALFLADNAAWLASFPASYVAGADPIGMRVSREQREVLRALDTPELRGHLLFWNDTNLAYMATVYTPLRSWTGHSHETVPTREERVRELEALFEDGEFLPEWEDRPLVVVVSSGAAPSLWLVTRRAEVLLESPSYRIYRVPPRSDRPG